MTADSDEDLPVPMEVCGRLLCTPGCRCWEHDVDGEVNHGDEAPAE